MPVKIRYQLNNDTKFYTCIVTYGQFQELSEFPIVKNCEIVQETQDDFTEIKNKMQDAIDLVSQNNVNQIRKLSELDSSKINIKTT